MNRILLDTHAVLWWLADDPRFSERARSEIADAEAEVLVSAASIWEIAIKRALGRLRVPDALPDAIEVEGFQWLPITPAHSWAVGSLGDHHRDPFDRMLVAQAGAEDVPLVSSDAGLAAYEIEIRW